uniref:Reticulon domain-containing protein n=1 Tax=Aegilops tauschii subsp. strangulata TaxID=200361 RepID=A0A453I5A5_AEGTS
WRCKRKPSYNWCYRRRPVENEVAAPPVINHQKVKEETTSPFPSPPSPDYFLSPKRLASSPIPPRSKGLAMETSASGAEPANAGIEGSADPCSSAGGGHRLSVHQIVGGGKAADIVLWKCKRATVGVIFGATIAWWLFEKSELSFLTICCDVLLILIVVQLIWVKISGLLNK